MADSLCFKNLLGLKRQRKFIIAVHTKSDSLCFKNLLSPKRQSSGLELGAILSFERYFSALSAPISSNEVSVFKLPIKVHFKIILN